jgi:glyoxylase-like metal-dependent hydrolase (beta-lactamase superfamily II)
VAVKIHHINCGTMCPFCARLINGRGGWTERAKMVCHCLLVETPESLVLIDTGLGTQDVANAQARLGLGFIAAVQPKLVQRETALAQVKRLGYDPRDVRHIVPTHLDLDHAGGLSDFPEAQVHVYKAELDAAMHPTRRERARYKAKQFAHGPKWNPLNAQGEKWFGFDSIQAIPGLSTDVLLIPLIGHTRGHCGVAVRDGERWAFHCGDAYFHHGTLESPPHMPAGLAVFENIVQTFRDQRLANQARLRDLAANHRDTVDIFCAHDPVEYERLGGIE